MKAVILAAGFGSRLWPISTSDKPKQFLKLVNGKSLLEYRYDSLKSFFAPEDIYVLTLRGLEHHVAEILPDLQSDNMILVPARHGTLPHTIYALNQIQADADEPVLFKSVDHIIDNREKFESSFKQALQATQDRNLQFVHFCPGFTAYDKNEGYCLVDAAGKVQTFLEKPESTVVEKMQSQGTILRSAFIFAVSIAGMERALQDITAEHDSNALQKILFAQSPEKRDATYMDIPVLDMSKVLFQHAGNMHALEITYDYTDIGQFSMVHKINDKDADGNVVIGDAILEGGCKNSLVINDSQRPLVVMSLQDSVVVQTDNGSMTAPFSDVDSIGEIYKQQILT